MAGQEDGVEGLGAAGGAVEDDPVLLALDARHGAVEAHPLPEGGDEAVDVGPGAAGDDSPDGAILDRQQAMIEEEANEEAGRKAQHELRVRGPDGGAHGQDVVVPKEAAVGVGGEVVAETEFVTFLRQQSGGLAVEAQYVPQHAPEARLEQVGAQGEEAVEGGAVVFQAAGTAGDAETHVAGLARHP